MHRPPQLVTWLVLWTIAAAPVASGCRSMQPVPSQTAAVSTSPRWDVRPGDDLRLTLNDGRSVRIEVKAVQGEAILASDGAAYAFADIRSVERRAVSPGRTLGLVAGAAGAALLAVLIATAAFLGSVWSAG